MSEYDQISRRDFLGLLSGLLLSPLPVGAVAPQVKGDYKALVYLYLTGGNDSNNMLIPTQPEAYASYANKRNNMAVRNRLLEIPTSLIKGANQNPYFSANSSQAAYLSGVYPLPGSHVAVNALMPELAALMAQHKAKGILNVGALREPLSDQVSESEQRLPVFLFSHKHQSQTLFTGNAQNLEGLGWGGRIADSLVASNSAALSAGVSYSGKSRWLEGTKTRALTLKAKNIPRLQGIGNAQSQSRRLFYELNAANELEDSWEQYLGELSNQAAQDLEFLYQAWKKNSLKYQSKTLYGNELFVSPSKEQLGLEKQVKGHLLNQLKATAKMIHLNAEGKLGHKSQSRQMFFVSLKGFDTHSRQLNKHPLLLRELSLALESFDKAISELGLSGKVKTYVSSEFNRTLTSNGDGTDHGWGGHHLVLGQFNNSQPPVIGDFPDFNARGDKYYNRKGRFIPDISQDQVAASLAYWFGVPEQELANLFVHLPNFQTTPDIKSALFNELI